jgi:hypothetical protein
MDNKVAGQCQVTRKYATTEKITLRLTARDIKINLSIFPPYCYNGADSAFGIPPLRQIMFYRQSCRRRKCGNYVCGSLRLRGPSDLVRGWGRLLKAERNHRLH